MMKKRVLALVAALVMTMSVAAPVFAGPSKQNPPKKNVPPAPKTGEMADAVAAVGGIVILGGVAYVSASKMKKARA